MKIAEATEVPSLDICVLSLTGAGKTVYLSSLYHHVNAVTDRHEFVLTCVSPRQASMLADAYDVIARTQDWPTGLIALNEFDFLSYWDSSPRADDVRPAPLFELKFVDVAWGMTFGPSAGDDDNAVARISRAHAILVLIDGQKVWDHLRGASSLSMSLFEELTLLCPALEMCTGRPIHFVITKADLIRGKDNTLAKIKSIVLSHSDFRSIVAQQKHASMPAHLIPVSAVGDKFVRYVPEANRMEKVPGGMISPVNLDVSLAIALVDALAVARLDILRSGIARSQINESLRGEREKRV